MNKLAYWRTQRRMSVRTLAEKSGVATSTIVHLEKGHNRGHLLTLAKLAEALTVPVEQLQDLLETDTPTTITV